MSDTQGELATEGGGGGERSSAGDFLALISGGRSSSNDENRILATVDPNQIGRPVTLYKRQQQPAAVGMANSETQIPHHFVHPPLLQSGKVIDIPTTSSSGGNTSNSNSSSPNNNLVLRTNVAAASSTNDNSSVSDERRVSSNFVVVVPPVPSSIVDDEPSGSGSVPINNDLEVPDVVESSSSSSSGPQETNSSEIATIDTDTDDDVILVAPQMEVIEVADEDDEDVQIVSHTRSQPIPKPLPERSRLSNQHHHRDVTSQAVALPPVLPPPQFEIEEEIDNNLPVERLLDDLFNSHFGSSIDFELPLMEPSNSPGLLARKAMAGHEFNSAVNRNLSITEQIRMIKNPEIAIQTEVTSFQEVATQTDPTPEPKKRKWY